MAIRIRVYAIQSCSRNSNVYVLYHMPVHIFAQAMAEPRCVIRVLSSTHVQRQAVVRACLQLPRCLVHVVECGSTSGSFGPSKVQLSCLHPMLYTGHCGVDRWHISIAAIASGVSMWPMVGHQVYTQMRTRTYQLTKKMNSSLRECLIIIMATTI